jgi:hypothetical protein
LLRLSGKASRDPVDTALPAPTTQPAAALQASAPTLTLAPDSTVVVVTPDTLQPGRGRQGAVPPTAAAAYDDSVARQDAIAALDEERRNTLTVAGAALEIAKFLKPHRKLLVSAGYPATFLADLQHEARELALGAKQTAAARAARAKATSDIARELRKGMQTVTVIEGLVLLHHGRDKATVRFWKNRRRVGARVGRPPRRKGQRASAVQAMPAS